MSVSTFDLSQWQHQGACLIKAIGLADFPRQLLTSIFAAVEIDSAFVVAHSLAQRPVILEDERVRAERRDEVLRYLAGPYLLDPVHLACIEGRRQGLVRLQDIAPDHFHESEYYRSFYVSHGLADEVNYLIRLEEGGGIAVSLGRLAEHGPFDAAELEALESIEPIVSAAAQRHWAEGTLAAEYNDAPSQALHAQLERAFDDFGRSVLTEREGEVARLILRGHSSKSIARALDITPDTVRVHRKNIHTKLNIGSQGELFSLFINAIACARGNSGEDPLQVYLSRRTPI